MQSWADEELKTADLGDARLNKRLIKLVEDLASQPTASVPQACGSPAAVKATYRFWAYDHVSPASIRAAHIDGTRARTQGQALVIVVQDTTEVDLSRHPATRGLGPLASAHQRGILVHSCLALTMQGVPQGLIDQAVWTRDENTIGKRKTRRNRPTEEKESQKWLDGLEGTCQGLPEGTKAITVADREADIYALFAKHQQEQAYLLIRATHNRRVDGEQRYLLESINRQAIAGQVGVEVGRRGDMPARKATLTVRFTSLKILPPRHAKNRAQLEAIPVQVILAREEESPTGVTPVSWLLLTTLPVGTLEEAVQCTRWYSWRWLIERYHLILKSGCGLEDLQLETADRMERALATYCIVAWRLLWLTYLARSQPEVSCEVALEPTEWQALYCTINKTPVPAQEPPSLRQAVRWIGRLGGHLGRTHDGEPGVKTVWRGFTRLHDIAATWELAHASPPPT
jgi:hypothetical protein